MSQALTPIREFSTLDDEAIRREVLASARPAVLRGLVNAWPAVGAGRRSPAAVVEYLRRFDHGDLVDAIDDALVNLQNSNAGSPLGSTPAPPGDLPSPWWPSACSPPTSAAMRARRGRSR